MIIIFYTFIDLLIEVNLYSIYTKYVVTSLNKVDIFIK